MSDRFNFENKDLDFPFYNKNPHVPKWGWLVLFLVLPLALLLAISENIPILIFSCLIIIVPVLYFLKWDYKAIFQKPTLRDIALALGLCVGYLIYASVMGLLLEQFGIFGAGMGDSTPVSLISIPPLFFSLMVEEFIKFIPFMFFLRVFYKYSHNRKLSVIFSMILVMIFFASLHAYTFNMLIFAIFVQGFGSIFEFIGYTKTKNIMVSYITHLCTDVLIYI